MKFRQWIPIFLLGAMSAAMAQIAPDDPDWKEAEAPPAPAFNLEKLIPFDSQGSGLVYAIDPATLSIGKTDGIVRYVVVASSPSGTRNIMYEALRCSTGESKTYARYSNGKWSNVADPKWRSVFGGQSYPLRFARAGGCQNAAPPTSPDHIVRSLRDGEGHIAN
jgi:hypothetical protein